MNSQKTILLPLLFGLTLRNFLRTDFLKEVLNSSARLVCLIPDMSIQDIRGEFESLGVEFYPYPRYEPSWFEKRLRDIREAQFAKTFPMTCLEHKANELAQNSPMKHFLNYKILNRVIPSGDAEWLTKIFQSCHRLEKIDEIWDEVKPDVLLSTNSFFWEELPLLAKAKKTQTPVYGYIHSWDNLTTKYRLPYRFTKTGLWNDLMAQEMKQFYPSWASDSEVIGVTQFDYYNNIENVGKGRKEFLRDLGLNPKYPLVSYTTVPDRISPCCFDDVKILLEAIDQNYFGTPVNVLVRFHQTGNIEPFVELKNYPNLHVEKPGRMNPKMKDLYNPTWGDMVHFADTLRHSDCTINVRSTVTIDASFFNIPTVNVGGDFSSRKTHDAHIQDLYLWEHYLPIIDSGAVELVKTPDDYLKSIKRSLEEPVYREVGREKLKKMFSSSPEGQAGVALARSVLSLLN